MRQALQIDLYPLDKIYVYDLELHRAIQDKFRFWQLN